MFDRQKLRDIIIGLFASSLAIMWIGSGEDNNRTTAGGVMFLAALLLSIYMALRPTVIPVSPKKLFESNYAVNQFRELMATDPDLNQAVQYCFNLSSEDFLRFTRLVVEYRDEANQKGLKDVVELFRRGG